jgi:hypothetical protein
VLVVVIVVVVVVGKGEEGVIWERLTYRVGGVEMP